jgi:hypothetical protein
MIEVLKRVIQRYKYLQKPLEEDFMPNILGYLGKWSVEDREKLAEATALFIIELQSSPKCLASLTKEHVSKDGVALAFITSFFKAYLARQNVDHLSTTLKRSGLRDLLLLFPVQTRDRKHLEEHFKKENLSPILDWYNKLALIEVKDETILNITRMVNDEESNEQVSLCNAGLEWWLTADPRLPQEPAKRKASPRSRSMRLDPHRSHAIPRRQCPTRPN